MGVSWVRRGEYSNGVVGAMSSSIELFGFGWCTGVYFLRNFLFLRVVLPDPSILIVYWWY